MSDIKVIPDSSFIICFLDDIQQPQYLIRIFNYDGFTFIIGRIVKNEISRSRRYDHIKSIVENAESFEYYYYGEILRPFLSIEEIEKGEHEVIATAYVMHSLGFDIIFILDEDDPRKFVENNFPDLVDKMTGTVGFIEKCHCVFDIFEKDESIDILRLIKNSKFRVKAEIIEQAIENIRRC